MSRKRNNNRAHSVSNAKVADVEVKASETEEVSTLDKISNYLFKIAFAVLRCSVVFLVGYQLAIYLGLNIVPVLSMNVMDVAGLSSGAEVKTWVMVSVWGPPMAFLVMVVFALWLSAVYFTYKGIFNFHPIDMIRRWRNKDGRVKKESKFKRIRLRRFFGKKKDVQEAKAEAKEIEAEAKLLES